MSELGAAGRNGAARAMAGAGRRMGGAGLRKGGTGRGGRGGGERRMVPDATFTSYYGRPVVKPSPWEADIPAYLFLGGLAAGSALVGAGGDLTGRPGLRRSGRLAAVGAITVSFGALVHDLGRPERFVNMLRVAKPTSPMSVGTWLLTAFGPAAGLAGAAELASTLDRRLPARTRGLSRALQALGRPAGLASALVAPTVAAYTAVLLADTATPTWNAAKDELPFVFVGSAAAASGGLAMIAVPVDEAGPARRLALGGAVLDVLAAQRMEQRMGMVAEPLHTGTPGKLMRASKAFTTLGALGSLVGGRSRLVSRAAGACLLAGSVCTRFGIFHAGQESARDPRYTIVPQRERVERRQAQG